MGVLLVTAGVAVLMDRHGVRVQAACAGVDVVVARGTGEPGPLGQVVGDPVFAAMQQAVTTTQLTASAVNYPASVAPGSAGIGNTNLVNMVTGQMAACPGQQFVLVGYSQGANVVDNSLGVSSAGAVVGSPITAMLPAAAMAKVDAILLFGNPIRAQGKAITGANAAKTMDVCANGDPICMAGGNNPAAHLSYTQNASMAAAFAARMIAAAGAAN